jgi:hypothetical protein
MTDFTFGGSGCISCRVHVFMLESIQSALKSIKAENEQLSVDVEFLWKGLQNFQNSLVPAVCAMQDTLAEMLARTPPTTGSQPDIQEPEAVSAPPSQQPMEQKRKRTTSASPMP